MTSRRIKREIEASIVDGNAPKRRLPDRLLTVRDFAEAAALGVPTVRRWIARRQIASVRVGNRAVRIPETELMRLISDGLVSAADTQ